jgi:hypothetical protein
METIEPEEVTTVSSEYTLRKNSGHVEVSYNGHIEPQISDTIVQTKIVLAKQNNATEKYRFMVDWVTDRTAALEERTETLATEIVRKHQLEAPSVFHVPSQDSIVAVGN